MTGKNNKVNLTESLELLNGIVQWFEDQDNVDVEVGLEKVRDAAKLIKSSKTRLAEIENEFKEIEKDIGDDEPAGSEASTDDDINPDDLNF